MVSIASQQDFI